MKYFEDERITKLTSELTDATLGRSRSIHGRLEAYTMKRAGTDHKYAHALAERYVAEMETVESQLAEYKTFIERCAKLEEQQRPGGLASLVATSKESSDGSPGPKGRKRSMSTGTQLEVISSSKRPAKQQRRRSSSFDGCTLAKTAAQNTDKAATSAVFSKAALGNFGEMESRRLMTDLILTLNSSFPDYDFGSVRPSDFEKIPVAESMKRINERLSELAVNKESFLPDMWNAIGGVVRLADCEVYSYAPKARDEDEDPLSFLTQTLIADAQGGDAYENTAESSSLSTSASDTVLWNFNYFFVDKAQKRIVYFTCVESMRSEEATALDDDDDGSFVRFHGTEASDVDFDLDPSSHVAGGIPISTI